MQGAEVEGGKGDRLRPLAAECEKKIPGGRPPRECVEMIRIRPAASSQKQVKKSSHLSVVSVTSAFSSADAPNWARCSVLQTHVFTRDRRLVGAHDESLYHHAV